MFLEPPTYYNHAFLAEENLHALHTLHTQLHVTLRSFMTHTRYAHKFVTTWYSLLDKVQHT